jgi:hypothetical protein
MKQDDFSTWENIKNFFAESKNNKNKTILKEFDPLTLAVGATVGAGATGLFGLWRTIRKSEVNLDQQSENPIVDAFSLEKWPENLKVEKEKLKTAKAIEELFLDYKKIVIKHSEKPEEFAEKLAKLIVNNMKVAKKAGLNKITAEMFIKFFYGRHSMKGIQDLIKRLEKENKKHTPVLMQPDQYEMYEEKLTSKLETIIENYINNRKQKWRKRTT